jgi:hypothetical protein
MVGNVVSLSKSPWLLIVRFRILAVANIKLKAFWDIALRSLIELD